MAAKDDTSQAQPLPTYSGMAYSGLTQIGTKTGLGLRDLSRAGRIWRVSLTAVWLIYLIQPVSGLFGHHYGTLYIAGGLAIVAAFCVIFVALIPTWSRLTGYWQLGLAGLFALAILGCVVYGGTGATTFWIFVSLASGLVIPEPRKAARAVAASGILYSIFCLTSHVSTTNFLVNLLPTLLVGFAMIGLRRQIQLARELGQARETVAKLAANEERLRLARDMHDLTGQSLSMITLKSELAAKFLGRLPASAERDKVLAEIGDIGRVSRQTLHDIREAVSGYRRPTLAIEIITARTALESAGIQLDDDPQLTLLSGTFDPDAEAALAWCMREAVTNVIRHSGARNCYVRLTRHNGELSLEVRDDGHGFLGASGEQASAQAGTGLHGMSERLSAVGGRLSLTNAHDRAGHGFRLVATVPAGTERPEQCEREPEQTPEPRRRSAAPRETPAAPRETPADTTTPRAARSGLP